MILTVKVKSLSLMPFLLTGVLSSHCCLTDHLHNFVVEGKLADIWNMMLTSALWTIQFFAFGLNIHVDAAKAKSVATWEDNWLEIFICITEIRETKFAFGFVAFH
jgi:hypothetical protein